MTFKLIVAALLFVLVAFGCLRLVAAWRESVGASAPSDGRMVSTAKGEIFVQVRGPDCGPPVILVPGAAAWSGFWLEVADELAAFDYRVIAVDLPPFGFSARSAEGAYGRADQAARLAALIEAMGPKNPVVVGHSVGAGAVVELAITHPDAIAGMVLIDPVLGLPVDGQSVTSDHPILRWLLDQPAIAQTLVAATIVDTWATRPLLAAQRFRKEAATQRQADILAVPCYRDGATAAYALAAVSAVAGDERGQRDARGLRPD